MGREASSITNVEEEYFRRRSRKIQCTGSDWKTPIILDAGGIKNERVLAFPIIDLDQYNDDQVRDDDQDDVFIVDDPKLLKKISFSSRFDKNIRKLSFSSPQTVIEIGESSNQYTSNSSSKRRSNNEKKKSQIPFCCAICFEPKPVSETFTLITGCSHTYCTACIKQYIASKIQENRSKITCPNPDCKNGFLKAEDCHSILPPEVFDRWCTVLCEALLFGSSAFYCPFEDCSAPLLTEVEENSSSIILQEIRQSECPHCWRLFCAHCKVPWHAGFSCEDFQQLESDERNQGTLSILNMAKEMKWQRCPKCKIIVDKIDGCMFMKCRCGFAFCYRCGTQMITDHYCKKCKC